MLKCLYGYEMARHKASHLYAIWMHTKCAINCVYIALMQIKVIILSNQ